MARGGFGKYIIRPDEKLSLIVGSKDLRIPDFIKEVWVYIKANKLMIKSE